MLWVPDVKWLMAYGCHSHHRNEIEEEEEEEDKKNTTEKALGLCVVALRIE